MIGHLRGEIAGKKPPQLLLSVGGVGYELEASMTTFSDLPEVGARASLFVHMLVREDSQRLYGFSAAAERDLFRALLKVNGVGPRVALAILSGMTPPEFRDCVSAGDAGKLVRVPGIGRRTAERLLVEMRDRMGEGEAPDAAAGAAPDPVRDAVSALVALGYKPAEAIRAVRAAGESGAQSSEQLIRAALRTAAAGRP
ncbi:MAG: Holliday junction branch migration protein RuvA [Gammaproteobacteria bacterium]|nr:Holliday junction branch migration protein RuvA [Gammaproteobacteria bacterium]MDD9799199.1 Holliday junction branch migration protein RuvA [Gammaproteobacteria bacterium]MDD9814415.1 Holliday junction branch migration protein RuvA [Gammaproteobacteria bacterium]MDD9851765.1 Holliday junction branch migration protein RuvA [Gammaproteobacteria bacterium]MDD9871638.1 Holliday junction branch migration protein RuvA [Gammaproteobacteria bacterium]